MLVAIWRHVRDDKPIRSPQGLVDALMRTVQNRRHRRAARVEYRPPDLLLEVPASEASEAPTGQAAVLLDAGAMRGARARWFVQRVQAGCSIAQMAEELAQPVKEVRRRVLELAARLIAAQEAGEVRR